MIGTLVGWKGGGRVGFVFLLWYLCVCVCVCVFFGAVMEGEAAIGKGSIM